MGDVTFWILISIAALVIDIATASFFIAGFTVGGIFAILAHIWGFSFEIQLTVFGIVSVIAVALEYVWFRKKIKKSIPKTLKMEDEYIGRRLTAEDDIHERGRMKVEGIYWTIENKGEPIKKGESFEIIGIKGNKILIKK